MREAEWKLLRLEHQLDTSIALRDWARHLSAEEVVATILDDGVLAGRRLRPHLVALDDSLPGAAVALRSDEDVPDGIRHLSNAPFGMRLRGARELLVAPLRVGVVGSRHPTIASQCAARDIASAVAANGGTVVSGLAIGVDGIAHDAALQAGGTTIAVLGSGCDRPYPAANRGIARRMLESGRGLLVSEYADHAKAFPDRFPARNRIIAGLSTHLVVVQARNASGSMQTVDHALGLGIDVMVVAGGWNDPEFSGARALANCGSPVVLDVAGLLQALGLAAAPGKPGAHELAELLAVPRSADEVAAHLRRPVTEALRLLVELQMRRLVARTQDGLYANVGAEESARTPHPLP